MRKFEEIKRNFKNKIDDKIWKYLIDRKSKFYLDLAEKTDIFNLTTLDDVFKNHPGFKIESIYLAGGMDKAKDVGAGWRSILENEFESYPGKKTGLPEITITDFGKFEPKRIPNDKYVDMFIEKTEELKKLYNMPLILNPIRKEMDRTKDKAFHKGTIAYKTFTHETTAEEFEPTFTNLRKTMSRSIEVGDEHLVRLADCIFLGLNQAAAAGTYAELQLQSLMNKPIFVWMTDEEWKLGQTKEDPYGGFSFWTLPHISKIARNREEMKTLVKTIIAYSEKTTF